MKHRRLVAVILGLAIIPAPVRVRPQSKSLIQAGSSVAPQRSQNGAQARRSAQHDAVPALLSDISEIRQQLTEQARLIRELKAVQDERLQDSAVQGQLVKYTRWLVYVGIIQFIALIFQAFIFFLTLNMIRTQANLMKIHAVHLENLSIAAKENAIAAKANLEALISIERAWILVDTGDIADTFEVDRNTLGIFDVRPMIRNGGRTPGWITRGFIRSVFIPTGHQLPPVPDYRGGLTDVPVNIIVAPNGSIQALHQPIALSALAAARQGTQKIYIYGFVDYRDFANQAGQIRQSRFCIEYHVPVGFDPQPRGFYMAVDVPIEYTRCT